MSRSCRVLIATLGMLLLPLAACSSTSTSTPSTPGGASSSAASSASGSQIVISGFKFSPDSLTVKPGQVVTVVNKDSTTHTLTASTGKAFDTGAIAPGSSGTFTAPSSPGSYPYICSIHPSMHGTLTVQ